jgi:hypothetical protein
MRIDVGKKYLLRSRKIKVVSARGGGVVFIFGHTWFSFPVEGAGVMRRIEDAG